MDTPFSNFLHYRPIRLSSRDVRLDSSLVSRSKLDLSVLIISLQLKIDQSSPISVGGHSRNYHGSVVFFV